MTVKIVGIMPQKFVIDGREIEGQRIYYTYEHQKVNGNGTGSVFETNGTRNIGDTIEVRWSKEYQKFYVKK